MSQKLLILLLFQLGAVSFDGDDSFDIYLQPSKQIQAKASEVNNLVKFAKPAPTLEASVLTKKTFE